MSYKLNTNGFACIKDGIEDTDITWASDFGKHLALTNESNDTNGTDNWGKPKYRKNLTTSQLRKFFGELRTIEALSYQKFNLQKILLIKPKLAYAVGREKKEDKAKIGDFYVELSSAITQIENAEHFSNFVKLVEAVVAYHKYHGGKD